MSSLSTQIASSQWEVSCHVCFNFSSLCSQSLSHQCFTCFILSQTQVHVIIDVQHFVIYYHLKIQVAANRQQAYTWMCAMQFRVCGAHSPMRLCIYCRVWLIRRCVRLSYMQCQETISMPFLASNFVPVNQQKQHDTPSLIILTFSLVSRPLEKTKQKKTKKQKKTAWYPLFVHMRQSQCTSHS